MKRLALAAVALTACHDLPDLGTCGNGVVESSNGEACDGASSGVGPADASDLCSETCLLTCQTSAVNGYVQVGVDATRLDPMTMQPSPVFCPEGMRCGLDSVCRAASGKFGIASTPQPFDVRNVAVGDVDGDRVDDIIGSSATGFVVRFGSQAGTPFADGFVQDAPSSESPVAFFDRDPARPAIERPDLAIAVPTDGLSFLTSAIESFAPDLDVFVDLTMGHRYVTATDPGRIPGLGVDIGDVVMSVPTMGPIAPRRTAVPPVFPVELVLAPCGPANAQLIDVVVPRFDRRSIVVVIRTSATNWATCVYRQDTAAGVWLPPTVTQFNANPPTSVTLADIEDDSCRELVVARAQMGQPFTVSFVRASLATGCNFQNTQVQFTNVFTEPQVIFDAGSIIPEAPSRDEVVMTSGVYRVVGGGLELVAAPTSNVRPWTSAALVDLNNDNILDVVAGRAGQDDVDVVRGGAQPNVYRADTDFPIKRVVAGDFDGDRLGDVALVENAVAGGDRLSILYGSADGFIGPAIPNSAIGGSIELGRMGPFNWGGTVRGNDGIDDLVVARLEGTGARGGIMLGDAPRLLLMPRFPPTPVETIGAIAAGAFPTAGGTKVLVAAVRSPAPGESEVLVHDVAANAWLPAVRIQSFEIDPTVQTQILRGTVGMVVARGAIDPMMASRQTMAVIGLDGKTCTLQDDGRINVFHGADLDDDGVDELVYATENANNAFVARQVHVRKVLAGQTGTCSGEELLVEALAGCDDVARIAGTTVALCEGPARRWGVHRIDDATGKRDPQPFAEIEGVGLQLAVGDFDGDGVPDLGVGMARAEVGGQFIRQCPAHDVRGCR